MFWFSVLLPQMVREGVPSTECAIEGVCAVFTNTHLQRASYSMFHEDVLTGMNAVGSLRIGSQDTVGELLGLHTLSANRWEWMKGCFLDLVVGVWFFIGY